MQRIAIFILAAMLASCAGTRQERRPEERAEAKPAVTADKKAEAEKKSEEKFEPALSVVTSNLDDKPEPVGGAAAIRSAVQEPEEVWKENKTGTTVVEARVSANGKIAGAKVYKSSGYSGMDAEAMLAVARVRWKPGRKNNQAVESVVRVTIEFNSSLSTKY